ncbi:hypothetical protein QVD17_27588 [Tagetes erecta]|uniref:Uncharacterized protein n=1 Tax=Tagetes erecta TaxID=13708 RepID=A0AAD8NRR4_TARER|nr:hypothetical protein QVD17_27588 [Tagetes erecta]
MASDSANPSLVRVLLLALPSQSSLKTWKLFPQQVAHLFVVHLQLFRLSFGPNKAHCIRCGTIYVEVGVQLVFEKHIEDSCKTLKNALDSGQPTMLTNGQIWHYNVEADHVDVAEWRQDSTLLEEEHTIEMEIHDVEAG